MSSFSIQNLLRYVFGKKEAPTLSTQKGQAVRPSPSALELLQQLRERDPDLDEDPYLHALLNTTEVRLRNGEEKILTPALKKMSLWSTQVGSIRHWKRPIENPKPRPRHLNYIGLFDQPCALSSIAQTNADLISDLGISLQRIPVSLNDEARRSQTCPFDPEMLQPGIHLFHLHPPELSIAVKGEAISYFQGAYNILYLMWESEVLPLEWKFITQYFDEIWTASSFCADIFHKQTQLPVRVIPHAVDLPETLPDLSDRFDLPEHVPIGMLLFDANSTAIRKNPLAGVAALRNAARVNPNLFIVVKIRAPEHDSATVQQLKECLQDLHCLIIEEELSSEETLSLIASSTFVISLHRSEGFGCILAEAMALGVPVIGTAYSGNMQFMSEENSYPVPYQRIESHPHREPFWEKVVWAEPDVDVATDLILRILQHPEEAQRKAHLARETIRIQYARSTIRKRFQQELERIFS